MQSANPTQQEKEEGELCQKKENKKRNVYKMIDTFFDNIRYRTASAGTEGISLVHSCASLIRRQGIWLP